MTKDEMKNKISMALKDPILQQGFEIICKENAELKQQVSFLEDNLRVARKDRENLQLDVAKGLKEFVKDYPATSLRYLANEKYVEQLTKAKDLIENIIRVTWGEGWNYSLDWKVKAEQSAFFYFVIKKKYLVKMIVKNKMNIIYKKNNIYVDRKKKKA